MLSVIIPALNEEGAIGGTVDQVRGALTQAGIEHEIIVVNDGSSDRTGAEAAERQARVLSQPATMGYGHSILRGVRESKYDLIALIDGDGSYPGEQFPQLFRKVQEGFDMVVGVRPRDKIREGMGRAFARWTFRKLAEFATGTRIPDVNSGMRIMRKEMIHRFWDSYGSGYSFTTTTTLLSLMHGYYVDFMPIDFRVRHGKSKVRFRRDALRAAQVIVEATLLHNPIKIFLLLGAAWYPLILAGVVLGILLREHFWWGMAVTGFSGFVLTMAIGFLSVVIRRTSFNRWIRRPPEA